MTKPVAAPRPTQAAAILQATLSCLSDRGYARVSMRDIAREAGVALSQLTYHFRSKERLVLEALALRLQDILQELEPSLSTEKTPEGRLRVLGDYLASLPRKDPALWRLLLDLAAQSAWLPSLRRHLLDLVDRLSRRIGCDTDRLVSLMFGLLGGGLLSGRHPQEPGR